MATTYDASLHVGSHRQAGEGFLRRAFDRFVEARQREANRQILVYLQNLDDQSLHMHGYSDAQIVEIRQGKFQQ